MEPTLEIPLAAYRRPQPVSRALLWILGLGAFGLAFSITTMTFLPTLLGRYTDSRTLIGLVLAAEGVFALALSPVIGPWSDHFHTPLGRRRPFMLAALGPLAVTLCLVPFMPSFWTIAVVVLCFFAAYYVYEPPYRGLYPDMLPASVFGRAQGVQHLLRGIALGCGLIGGTALFKLWTPAPFLLAAAVTLVACGAVVLFVQEDGGQGDVFRGVGSYLRTSWTIFRREPDVRSFLVVNAAWEAAFAAARVFVLLYFLNGLHQSKSIAALGLSGVAVGYAAAALVCGRIGDRVGLARTCFYASFVYGGGLVLTATATRWHWWFPGFIFVFSLAGGTVMTLAWGLLFKLMPASERGAVSGLATMTKGIGLVVGPLAAGAAIDLLAPVFPGTDGYQALWLVCAVPILAVIPVVARLARHERVIDRR